jgi:amidohydrolase
MPGAPPGVSHRTGSARPSAVPVPTLAVLEPLTDEALTALLVRVRRHLHRHPEVGFDVRGTSAYLQQVLEEQGFEPVTGLAGEGFFVEIEGAHPGPGVGYRTELDALPTPDAKDVDYASAVPGKAHLCGHDAHMAVAVGVALLLRRRRDLLHGTARVFFQPNEEGTPAGAPRMVEDGVLDGLREVLCIHVDPTLEVGRFGLRAGAITSAASAWMVHLYSGQTGHSARPHETPDLIWLSTLILNALYQLPGRIHDARRTAVLTACQFHAGEALNVIPAEAEFGGTLRSPSREAIDFLTERMGETARQIAALHGAEARFESALGVPPVVNDPVLVDVARQAIHDLLSPDAAFEVPEPSMGGEDFAYYLDHVPGALVRVGTRGGPETGYPLHHSCFDVDERALPLAARLMAEVVTRRLARLA